MNHTFDIVKGVLFLVLVIAAIGFVVVRSVQKAEDPARMVFKWVLTVIMLTVMIVKVGGIVGRGGYVGGFIGIPLTALCGVILAGIWRHSIAGLVAKPFSSLYDGGDEEAPPRPAYSIAQSRQKQGKYLEAVAEVRKQLDRFPTDMEGQMLLAEIQAEDLKDLQGAELTIDRFLAQPNHAPANIAYALYSMADWHLAVGQDTEAARRDLERIVTLLPDSEFALGAAQRIAHLGNMDMILSPHDRKKFEVVEGPKNLGLIQAREKDKPKEIDPANQAADYVKHLELHPQDTEAREKLAVIYADHYSRLDLATDQLEQMIAQPNQPGRLVVHWLNLLADLQIRSGSDYETVKATLERIIDRNPELAAAGIARNRLSILKLEMKSKQKTESVKMGTYEQNIGLKQGVGRGGIKPVD